MRNFYKIKQTIKELYNIIQIFLNKKNRIKDNKKLKHKDFSIISNNCWAGMIYQKLNLK
jgi:uncharacterized protein (DUF1919 family)